MNKSTLNSSGLIRTSLVLTICLSISQGSGLLARLLFRTILDPNAYGILAYFLGLFTFMMTFAHGYLQFPVVAYISERPDDNEFYSYSRSNILTISLLASIASASILFLWGWLETGYWTLSLLFSLILIVYATSINLHAFPRGRDDLKSTGLSAFLTGIARMIFLLMFAVGFLLTPNLLDATVVYIFPFLIWILVYVVYDGVPRIKIPSKDFLSPYFKDSILSLLAGVSTQVPIVFSLITLESLFGFTIVGNFDIALIGYSVFSALVTGAAYVTLSKARSLPSFSKFAKAILVKLGPWMLVVWTSLSILSIVFAADAINILIAVGLPPSAYWPGIILVIFAVPSRIFIEIFVSYFQGRSKFKPIGVIPISIAILSLIPLFMIIEVFSIMGSAIGLGVINLITLVGLCIYGLKRPPPQS